MNDNTRELIKCICRNGKRNELYFWAKRILTSDKTAKDERFRQSMLEEIEKKESQLDVPPNCAMFTIAEKEPNINIDRYYLSDREKSVADKIHIMHNVSKRLLEKGIKGRNSIIFYGESGNGKTMFGRYIAYRLGIPFIYLNLSYLTDSLLGKTQQNLANVFRFVNGLECVFMIDEMDAIAVKRGFNNDVSEISRVTIALMQEIDNLSSGVVLLGATNRVDIIDDAVFSRFGDKHELKRFTEDERKEYVTTYFNNVEIPYTEKDIASICEESVTQRALERKVIDFVTAYLYNEIESEQKKERKEEV